MTLLQLVARYSTWIPFFHLLRQTSKLNVNDSTDFARSNISALFNFKLPKTFQKPVEWNGNFSTLRKTTSLRPSHSIHFLMFSAVSVRFWRVRCQPYSHIFATYKCINNQNTDDCYKIKLCTFLSLLLQPFTDLWFVGPILARKKGWT